MPTDLTCFMTACQQCNSKQHGKTPETHISFESTNFRRHKANTARPNVASKNIGSFFDHEVQARTVNKPFTGKNNDGPSDGAVLKCSRFKRRTRSNTWHNPRYSRFDTYHMTTNATMKLCSNNLRSGSDTLTGLDNLLARPRRKRKHTDGQYKLAQLVRSCQAL